MLRVLRELWELWVLRELREAEVRSFAAEARPPLR
jgi:hypothetical protein